MATDNQSVSRDLAQFVEFAVEHLENDGPHLSPEELLQRWRSTNRECWETVERIKQSLKEHEEGKSIPLEEAVRQIRERLECRRCIEDLAEE